MIKLTFYSKDKKRIFGTREVKIPPNGLIIGRGKNCNIQVEDPTVSRQHAVIYFKNNNYYIKDLKSENGTFVNDKKVDETILKPNDVIGIGKYLVEFTILSPETVGVSPSILYPIIAIFSVLAILLIVFFAKPTSTLTGLLKIDSDPQGAEVLINNEKKGITPISISLKEGSYEVIVKKDSYEDFEKKDIHIEKNKTLDLGVIKLTPLPSYATLEVETTPTNAKLYINGEEKGLTPYTVDKLKPGEYEIKITKSGYEDYKEKIALKDNENKTMKIQLKPITPTPTISYGSLSVDSDPSGANVYVDNKNIGKTPIKSYQLEPGSHTIKLSLDGYNDYISNVTISSNSTKNLGKISLAKVVTAYNFIVRLLYYDGRPRADQYIQVHKQTIDSSGNKILGEAVAGEKTDKNGEVKFNLNEGIYAVFTQGPGMGWTTYDILLGKGDIKVVELKLGKLIIDLSDDYAGKKLWLRDTNDYTLYSFNLDVKGNYETDLVPGVYYISDFWSINVKITIESGKFTRWDGENVYPPTPP